MVHIHNGKPLRHKNEQNSAIYRDMDRLSYEGSQKEKNKHSMLTHICGIYKNDTDELICKTEIETKMYRTNYEYQRRKLGWDELGDWD